MSLTSSPSKVDLEARALRERFELVVIGDDDHAIAEAARALFWFCSEHPEYRLFSLIPESAPAAPEEPKRIASKYAGRCKSCRGFIEPGAEVYWTPGEKGVRCLSCGGGAKP